MSGEYTTSVCLQATHDIMNTSKSGVVCVCVFNILMCIIVLIIVICLI